MQNLQSLFWQYGVLLIATNLISFFVRGGNVIGVFLFGAIVLSFNRGYAHNQKMVSRIVLVIAVLSSLAITELIHFQSLNAIALVMIILRVGFSVFVASSIINSPVAGFRSTALNPQTLQAEQGIPQMSSRSTPYIGKIFGTIIGGGLGLATSYLFRPVNWMLNPTPQQWFSEGIKETQYATIIYTCAAVGLVVGFILGVLLDRTAPRR